MSIASEIERLENAKNALKQALIDAGNTISSSATIDTYISPINSSLGNDETTSKLLLGEFSLGNLTKLIFSPGVNTAVTGALKGAASLTELVLPFIGDKKNEQWDNLDHFPLGFIFGNQSFSGAKQITQRYKNAAGNLVYANYYIPETLKKIGVNAAKILPTGALSGLNLLLDKITISNSADYVQEGAIGTDVKEIQLPYAGYTKYGDMKTRGGGEEYPFGYIFGNYYNNTTEAVPVSQHYHDRYRDIHTQTYYVPKNLKKIVLTGDYSSNPISGYDTPYIPYGAFENMTTLEEVILPDTLKILGCEAFLNCKNLQSITIPGSITDIQNCDVTGNNSSHPFAGCSSLASIIVEPNNAGYYVKNNCLYHTLNDEEEVLMTPTKDVTNILQDDKLVYIGGRAFFNFTTLPSRFILPNNVKWIEREAFCGSNLVSIEVPSNLQYIDNYAFWDCDKLIEIYDKSNLGITAGSTDNGYIGYYARNIYTPNSGSSKLSTVDNVTLFTDAGDVLAMGYNGSSTNVTIPNTATEVYKKFAKYNTLITSVVIGDNVHTIGEQAFNNCSNLSTISFGTNVNAINDNAFSNCTGLISVTVPDGVTSLGYSVFYGCTNLTTVSLGAGISSIPSDTFNCVNSSYNYNGNLTSLTLNYPGVCTVNSSSLPRSSQRSYTVYVPAAYVSAYEADSEWQYYINNNFLTIQAISA